MNVIFKQLFQSVVLAGLLPAIMISAISSAYSQTAPYAQNSDEISSGHQINVLSQTGDKSTMDLEDYVVGVVLGEVSTSFHLEALKAQAVAARTYTVYCIDVLKKHGGAVCTDYQCCQAFCDPENFTRTDIAEEELAKVISAVSETAGEVLNYNSELVCSTYFASSGGRTEDAKEVWGEPYPYLLSVDSPGEEECGYFSNQVSMTPEQLQSTLGVTLTGQPSSWFGMIKYTVGGGIDLMRIGGRLYTGVELRKLLKLRSTIMTITTTDDVIIIDTKGYGHRVGMSQHGANAMAVSGYDYRKILKHYYTGTMISQL